jgi:rSAM/selenodomain-associated transferase 1
VVDWASPPDLNAIAKGNRPLLSIFCKAPAPGYAKTRLIPRLGAAGAAKLHAALADRTLGSAVAAAIGAVEMWCTPDLRHAFFRRCRQRFHIALAEQPPGDLGMRMAKCFEARLTSAPFVIVIGTDCPDLDAQYLRRAAALLSAGKEAVVGPALDGGYVLLGLRHCPPRLFADIPWGTERVLDATRMSLQNAKLDWAMLEALRDIDTPADLDGWQRRDVDHPYRKL